MSKDVLSISSAGIIEDQGKLLLVKDSLGWGLPSGHNDKDDAFYPNPWFALFWEMKEEVNLVIDRARLWGFLGFIALSPTRISAGFVYKVEWHGKPEIIPGDEITGFRFFNPGEIRSLLDSPDEEIRKPKYNRPVLDAWLKKRPFLIKLSIAE